jgi:diguanylate cyclase (GGDEF)-like protein/PAS domain S-box-containing protein
VDLDRRFIEVNPALCSIVGRTEEWLLAHRIPDIIDPDDDALDLHMRAEVLSGSQTTVTHEKRLRRADGMTVWVSHSIGLLRDRAGRPSSYISTFADVSEGKAAQERLQYQATHDSLTRLVNRQDLFDRAESILSRAAVTRDRVGVLYVDVDGLKAINDTYGHSVGDVALVTVATRLDMIGRNQDIVSRIGGDEFVVLIPNLRSISDAEAIASRILLSMDEPIEHEGGTFTVTVSIGIALAEPGANTDETLKEADAALYQAKQDGRARWATYDKGIERA